MKDSKPLRRRRSLRERGFALIVVISMMVLLMLLGTGILGLASISLRNSGQGDAMAEARANARMALIIALGDLQRTLGPDNGISASSSLVHETPAESNVVGTWESWRWDPEEAGAAASPDYGQKSERFRRWLVSSNDPAQNFDPEFPATGLTGETRWLIEPLAGGDASSGLRGGLVTVDTDTDGPGGYAYAVMDESMKVPVQLPDFEPRNMGDEIARRTAPHRAAPETLIEALNPEQLGNPQRLVSLDTVGLAVGSEQSIKAVEQSLSTQSLSLLTDPVRGGFKTDLTTLFESDDAVDTLFDEQAPYFAANDTAPRWAYLRDHYQHYRELDASPTGTPKMEVAPRDLRPSGDGIETTPTEEKLMPVIAKLQIVFSIVTHYSHISDRVTFFNEKGRPRGNQNYGAPHLVYDPVITLYNPYDVELELEKLRVRIWDPPVVFGFKKNDDWLRPEFARGDYHGLARFQIANESNANARKFFTLLLTDADRRGRPGSPIKLEPGEVKVFSPWVETQWTWGYETAGGYNVRAFFDWNAGNDFGNQDKRTGNIYGVEAIPGWDPRAGLQTDHLSYARRPTATRYDFEIANGWDGGWLGIKNTDTFSVHAKPGRTVTERRSPDFVVDLLAGLREQAESDVLRSYQFTFEDVQQELGGESRRSEIERTFLVDDLLQEPGDPTPGGKSPFAILSMSAKTTVDPNDVSKPWLHNHPVVTGAKQNTRYVGNALDSYDIRFEEMQDFNVFPGIEVEPDTNRGYYGASNTANRGVSKVPMFRVPLLPAASLGDLVPANLVSGSELPRFTRTLGASAAHPLLPASSVETSSPVSGADALLDHAYLMNNELWDRYFFSTVGDFDSPLLDNLDRRTLLGEFFKGNRHLLNARFTAMRPDGEGLDDYINELDGLGDDEFARRIGANLAIAGGFNVNCDDPEVWKAELSSLRDQAVRGWAMREHEVDGKSAFPRMSLPLAGDAETADTNSVDFMGQVRWAGFRALSDEQIDTLANAIVEELRERGREDKAPSLTLGEFVNRRIGGAGQLHTLSGALATAIEKSGINDEFHLEDSKEITGSERVSNTDLNGIAEEEARLGHTGEGAPSILTQGDLLMALAPTLTVRGDTFRIRTYGESRDKAGDVRARAWCEAVVQRMPDYLDPADEPWKTLDELNAANRRFGRRFTITSFRWLTADEV